MRKDRKNDSWVEFGSKINYLLKHIFKDDEERLIYHFSTLNTNTKKNSRKKTIRNWLAHKTLKPNGFHLSKFKISEYTLNNQILLPINAFKLWSLAKFTARVDLYLSEVENPNTPKQMKYIYFLNSSEKKLSYFKIDYPNINDNLHVQISSDIYTTNMTYKGTITHYNNISYISVKNNFDYMNYIFKSSVNIYKKEIKVFGVAQCIDAVCGEPKAFTALLTSKKLTINEEHKYAHKLNFSNLIIADDFSYNCVIEEDYFLENFREKITSLNRDLQHYDIDKKFRTNMYSDIVLKEYKTYVSLLEKAFHHSSYMINNRRESLLFSFEEMCKEEKIEATISYVLGSEGISILDEKNPILETQLKLVKAKKLSLTYLFIIEEPSFLTQKMISKIEYIERKGIVVRIVTESKTIYSKILWIEKHNFAIYKMQNQIDDNVEITKDQILLSKLSFEINFLERVSIPLQEYIQEFCSLNGEWYAYSYTSKQGKSSYQEVKFNITNKIVKAVFPKKVEKGYLHITDSYVLLLLKHSIVKIHSINTKDTIFRVSIIGKEQNIYHRDVLLFGLMSRKKLTEKNVLMLLESMHQKEDEEFRIKLSNEFDSKLAYFNTQGLD